MSQVKSLRVLVAAQIPQLPINHRPIGKKVRTTQVCVRDDMVHDDDSWRTAALSTLTSKVRAIDRRFEAGMHFVLFELGSELELREQIRRVDRCSRSFL